MDTGEQVRIQILRQTAEQKFIEPLKTHGWTARIAREVAADSGYLVIEAERGGRTHKVALMYASATRNEVYRQLATETEHTILEGTRHGQRSDAVGRRSARRGQTSHGAGRRSGRHGQTSHGAG